MYIVTYTYMSISVCILIVYVKKRKTNSNPNPKETVYKIVETMIIVQLKIDFEVIKI